MPSLPKPPSTSCTVCAAALTVHERAVGNTCARPACRQARIKRDAAEALALRRDQQASARALLAQREPEVAAAVHFVAIVPSSDRPVTTLPARRISRFRHRLMRVITRAAERRWGTVTVDSGEDAYPGEAPALAAGDNRVLGTACATCRGHCCEPGGDHAFLHPHTVLRYWERHPTHRPAEVLDAYLSRLPPKAVSGSCVYHGATGCALPQAMQSHVCTRYVCRGAAELLATANETGPVAVAAANGRRVSRVAAVPSGRSESSALVPRSPSR
ncbi:MAG: hypothetical protein AAGD86_07800 [Pseudomonadota bacterium]